MSDERLIAIEAKIDKLGEAMLTLVRMEERQTYTDRVIQKLEERVDALMDQKQELVSQVQQVRNMETGTKDRRLIFERLIWLALSGGLGATALFEMSPK